ncbi:MAG: site-2 protease family protein [bacterium]|nr:site-2 protease family protein [bacterium]
MSIILFIIILAALILVHEFGHFIAAKRAGVRVDEFGLGFPPRLWTKKVGETLYSVNAFPVGGFVKIFGEDPNDESLKGSDSARSLTHKSKLVQAWIISAGVIFNLIFAWLLISVGFMVGLPYSVDDSSYGARVQNPALTITQVIPKAPAEIAGLKGGDVIVSLASGQDNLNSPKVEEAQKFIATHNEISLTYLRGKESKIAKLESKDGLIDGRRAIGISMDSVGQLSLPIHEALYMGLKTTASLTIAMAVGLFDFFKNLFIGQADFQDISGPVGIVGIVSDAGALGFMHLVTLTAIISINLAIINLLPFPALDGGRLFFLIIETIKRSPIKPIVANTANGIGFIILIAFMVFITFHDVAKIVQG